MVGNALCGVPAIVGWDKAAVAAAGPPKAKSVGRRSLRRELVPPYSICSSRRIRFACLYVDPEWPFLCLTRLPLTPALFRREREKVDSPVRVEF